MAETIKHDLEELLKSANDEAMAGEIWIILKQYDPGHYQGYKVYTLEELQKIEMTLTGEQWEWYQSYMQNLLLRTRGIETCSWNFNNYIKATRTLDAYEIAIILILTLQRDED